MMVKSDSHWYQTTHGKKLVDRRLDLVLDINVAGANQWL